MTAQLIDGNALSRQLRTQGAQNGCILALADGEVVTQALIDQAVALAEHIATDAASRAASPAAATRAEREGPCREKAQQVHRHCGSGLEVSGETIVQVYARKCICFYFTTCTHPPAGIKSIKAGCS